MAEESSFEYAALEADMHRLAEQINPSVNGRRARRNPNASS